MELSKHLKAFIQTMPKLDLHCHIDGSFSTEFIRNVSKSTLMEHELKKLLQAPPDCASLAEYLTCFDLPISCMQTFTDITDGVTDVLHQAAEENVKYIELRFAPTCSVNENLSYQDVIEAAIDGCKLGKEMYGIDSGIILCAMRHHDIETNLKVLSYGREYLGSGVCALDLAGDEAAFDNNGFRELFLEARRLDMPFTIHSGECGSSDNVRLALEFGAKRVGHGIALIKDPELMKLCKESRLGLELCPTSNFQTRAVTSKDAYPLRAFLNYGLPATVNTDNRTVSNTSITNEFEFIADSFDIREEDLITLYKNNVEISFANDNVKNNLLSLI